MKTTTVERLEECCEEKGKVARLTGLEPATPGVTGRYSNQLSYNRAFSGVRAIRVVARLTGLEPATPGVTGRYSNQLSYNRNSTRPDRRPNVERVIGMTQGGVKRAGWKKRGISASTRSGPLWRWQPHGCAGPRLRSALWSGHPVSKGKAHVYAPAPCPDFRR